MPQLLACAPLMVALEIAAACGLGEALGVLSCAFVSVANSCANPKSSPSKNPESRPTETRFALLALSSTSSHAAAFAA